MQMRPSRVLKKLRSGAVASCAKINLADPRSVEIAAHAGYDCVWLDTEHVPNTLEAIENQVRAAKIYDVDALVRVPRGSYSDYIRPLEMDAAGIMVPHLMSAEEAREVVRRTRFHPIGRRPIDGGNADGAYCRIPVAQYVAQANEQRFVVVQIEDPEPLDELDEIARVEGIDMILFGPGDFSHSIGAPGQWDDPRIGEARRLVAETAVRHGKFAGTVCGPEQIDEIIELGYRFINVGADVVGLGGYFREMVAAFGSSAADSSTEGACGGDAG